MKHRKRKYGSLKRKKAVRRRKLGITVRRLTAFFLFFMMILQPAGGQKSFWESLGNLEILTDSETLEDLSRFLFRLKLEVQWNASELVNLAAEKAGWKKEEGLQAGRRISAEEIPAYSGEAAEELFSNQPDFSGELLEQAKQGFERYGELDALGRCTGACASVGLETMPVGARQDISEITPSGWKNRAYDFIDGGYVYNRCHLIGYQLTAQNANEKNLITGTRYLNIEGMLPYENLIANYVEVTGKHVLYRVTPVYEGVNLVASGVLLEAQSVEDQGTGIRFCVYCFNVQPGVEICYLNGENQEETGKKSSGNTEKGKER